MPSSTPSRKLAIFSNPLPSTSSVDVSSPTTSAVLDRLVEVAGFDLGVAAGRSPLGVGDDVGHPGAGQAVRQERPVLAGQACCRAPPAPPRSTPRRACTRRRSRRSGRTARGRTARRRTPPGVAAQYTAPVARSPAGSSQSTSSAASTGTTVSDGSSASTDASACGQKSFRSLAMSVTIWSSLVAELGVALGVVDRAAALLGTSGSGSSINSAHRAAPFGEADLERADPVERRAVPALGELVDADRVADRDHREEPDAHVVVGELDASRTRHCGRGRPTRRRSSRPAAR